jgi:hypothetical protein
MRKEDGACTDSFENFRENSLKGDLSNDITLNPPLFSLVNTFKVKIQELYRIKTEPRGCGRSQWRRFKSDPDPHPNEKLDPEPGLKYQGIILVGYKYLTTFS